MGDPDRYAAEVCRRRIAGVCRTLGWHTAHASSLDLMTDLLRLYVTRMGRGIRDSAEICNRSSVNLSDVAATFARDGVDPEDLAEFAADFKGASGVDTRPTPPFPAPCPLQLNHLKPGSREVLLRKCHIYDHLPAMYPELEVETPVAAGAGDGQAGAAPAVEEGEIVQPESSSVGASPVKDGGGLPAANADNQESAAADPNGAAAGGVGADAMSVREISSVIMTTAGFISPAREGKLPESRGPQGISHLAHSGSSSLPASREASPGAGSSRGGTPTPSFREKPEARGKDKAASKQKLSVFQRKPTSSAGSSQKSSLSVPDHTDDVIDSVIRKGVADSVAVASSSSERKKPRKKSPGKKKQPKSEAFVNSPPSSPTRPAPPPAAPSPTPSPAKQPPQQKPLFSETPLIHKQLYGFGVGSSEGSTPPKKKSGGGEKSKEKHGKKKKEKKRDKSDKKDRSKGDRLKEKHKKSGGSLKGAETSTATPTGVKIKIKDTSGVDKPPTKVVFKNLDKKYRPKELTSDSLFQDPLKIERPHSSASTSSTPSSHAAAAAAAAAADPPAQPMSGLPISKSNIIPGRGRPKRGRPEGSKNKSKSSSSGSSAAADQQPPSTKKRRRSGRSSSSTAAAVPASAAAAATEDSSDFADGFIVEQTVGSYVDEDGNKIWICPSCGKQVS